MPHHLAAVRRQREQALVGVLNPDAAKCEQRPRACGWILIAERHRTEFLDGFIRLNSAKRVCSGAAKGWCGSMKERDEARNSLLGTQLSKSAYRQRS